MHEGTGHEVGNEMSNGALDGIGVVVIGDEILSGRRQDRHLAAVIERLAARGLDVAPRAGGGAARDAGGGQPAVRAFLPGRRLRFFETQEWQSRAARTCQDVGSAIPRSSSGITT